MGTRQHQIHFLNNKYRYITLKYSAVYLDSDNNVDMANISIHHTVAATK